MTDDEHLMLLLYALIVNSRFQSFVCEFVCKRVKQRVEWQAAWLSKLDSQRIHPFDVVVLNRILTPLPSDHYKNTFLTSLKGVKPIHNETILYSSHFSSSVTRPEYKSY